MTSFEAPTQQAGQFNLFNTSPGRGLQSHTKLYVDKPLSTVAHARKNIF